MRGRTPLAGLPVLRRCGGAAILLVGLSAIPAASDPATSGASKAGDSFAIESRTDKPDGSTALTLGRRLQTEWDAKVGVDVGLAPPLTTTPGPEIYLNGTTRQDQSTGAGWANVTVPASALGWEKAAVEARIAPAQDQGKIATTLSRSVPVSDGARLTIRNGYSLSETLASPGGLLTTPTKAGPPAPLPPGRTLATEGVVSIDVLSSATTFAACAKYSSTDDRWLRTLSAEQKLFGGPFSLTGSISERATGETDRSVKAGFKSTW